jgi:hypothetical protein
METLTTLTAKKTFIKDNLDKLSDESRPTLSQINAFKAEDLALVDTLVAEINSFVTPTEEETVTEPVEKVSDLKYETLYTDEGVAVEVVWLPFKKYGMRADKKTKLVKTNYQFEFGNGIITLQNQLLNPVKKQIEIGELFPIKVATIKPINDSTYGYSKPLYEAQIGEFACELLITERFKQLEDLEERSEMSAEAQAMLITRQAEAEVAKYLAKKGLKV